MGIASDTDAQNGAGEVSSRRSIVAPAEEARALIL